MRALRPSWRNCRPELAAAGRRRQGRRPPSLPCSACAAGIAAAIGSVGDAYDNALMESTIGLFKTELIKPRRPWKTLSQVELATAEWIDWYCHRRLHGEIGHVPPVEYETNYYLATAEPQVTTTI
ncbi:integrase core domain-containing protein [Streptomyces sp. NBC_00055]|uniref:integrase core domain-containing protein n=1 Tax=Streptomyces sp. NBC_00055 TaxID=2975632 RepID=UPI003248ADC4